MFRRECIYAFRKVTILGWFVKWYDETTRTGQAPLYTNVINLTFYIVGRVACPRRWDNVPIRKPSNHNGEGSLFPLET